MNKARTSLLLCLSLYAASMHAQEASKPVPPTPAMKVTKPAPLPDAQVAEQTTTTAQTGEKKAVVADAGILKFSKETLDLGEVEDGAAAECDFTFKNTGKSPVTISGAHASCGCTVADWPKEPIKPKHRGKIHVSYNTAGRVGKFEKDITITSDAQRPTTILHITGVVTPKPEVPKPVPTQTPPPPPPAN